MPTGDSTSNAALEAPGNGQGGQTSQQPGEATQAAPAKQDKPNNWYDDPKFREMQSKKDREVAEARQQAAQAAQQANYLQQQIRELQMRDMSADEQTAFQLKEAQQAANYWQTQYQTQQQQRQYEEEKRNAIKELLGDGDYPDVRESDLMETRSSTEAAKMAARLQRERSGKAQQELDERRQANRSDPGSGSRPSASPPSELQRKLDDARRTGNGSQFWNTFWEGNKAGADLK